MSWEEIENQLREAIRNKRGAQTEIARRLNIKQPSVANYVTGGGRIPPEHVDVILEVLGLKLEVQRLN